MIVRSGVALALVGALACSCSTSTSGTPRTAPSTAAAPTARSSLYPSAPAGAALAQPDVATAAAKGARVALAAINTYDYRTLDSSLAAALQVSTGAFATQYAKTFRTLIEPQATRVKAAQRAQVSQVAVQQVALPTSVQLLVAGSVRVSRAGKSAAATPFDAQVTMTLVEGIWRVSALDSDPQGTTPPAGTPAMVTAVAAAKIAVLGITTLARKTFDADYDAALAFTTGPLHSDLVARRAQVRTALSDGRFDLRGELPALGVIDAAAGKVRVLVDIRSYRVSGGKPGSATTGREVVTVLLVGNHWLASDLTSVT